MNPKAPIIILSFNRPNYLKRVLLSLRMQKSLDFGSRDISLFQDGATSNISSSKYADPIDVAQCVDCFRQAFPGKPVFESRWNIGVARNFDRAERYAFSEMNATAAIFLEDDLVLSPNYVSIVDNMLANYGDDERVGYVSAYGNHLLSIEEQTAKAHCLSLMHHNWGFGLFRRHWLAARPQVERYLALIGDMDYQHRNTGQVSQLFNSWGFGVPATSQDAAKTLVCCGLGAVKINTVACFAEYIGEEGLHMNRDEFKKLGYSSTEVFGELVTEFEPLTETAFREMRGALIKWAGRPRLKSEGDPAFSAAEVIFHKVSADAAAGDFDAAVASGFRLIGILFSGLNGNNKIKAYSRSRNLAIAEGKRDTVIEILLSGGVTLVGCSTEIFQKDFTNYFRSFTLFSSLLRTAAVSQKWSAPINVDVADVSGSGTFQRLAISASLSQAVLVIDPDFFHSRGYENMRSFPEASAGDWVLRRDLVFWRGASIGISPQPENWKQDVLSDYSWRQRLQLCVKAARSKHSARLDVGFNKIAQIESASLRAAIEEAGYLRSEMGGLEHRDVRHAFVMDGNSSADNGLLPALLSATCVMLIGSPNGFKSWFYDRLEPFVTHVPVAADLSDLEDRLDWVFAHPAVCQGIARRGHELVMSMDFESEFKLSVERVRAYMGQNTGR